MHILQELVQEAGYDCRSYSGRGMFGSQCLGVDLPVDISAFRFVAHVFDAIESDMVFDSDGKELEAILVDVIAKVTRVIEKACLDSMGKGTIIYFPSVQYEEQ